jgi:hypothetical protein
VVAGSSLRLLCNYTLQSVDTAVKENVTWMVNDSKNAIVSSKDSRIITSGATIKFSPLNTFDTGRYTCTLQITPQTPHVGVHGPQQVAWRTIAVQIPQPHVVISLSHTGKLHAGSNLILTCHVKLDPRVNNNEQTEIVWSGHEDLYFTVGTVQRSVHSYSGNLSINPLAGQDDGTTITCTATITGGINVARNNASIKLKVIDAVEELSTISNTTTLSLSWKPASKTTRTGYNISYFNTDKMCFRHDHSVSVGPNTTHHVLKDLEEYSQYTIILTALHESHVIGSKSVVNTTKAAVPSAGPSHLEVSGVTSFSITLQWEEVECIHRNGNITGYLVQFRQADNDATFTVNMSESVTETTISKLIPNTTYTISIAAVNSVGTGKSTNITEKTLVAEPLKGAVFSFIGPVAGAVVGAILLLVLSIFILTRWKRYTDSRKVRSKLLPFPRMTVEWGQEKDQESEKKEEEGIEMVTFMEQDKTKDPSHTVTGRCDVSVTEFPAYVRGMHLNGSEKLKNEYTSLEKLPLPSTEVARLPCSLSHNRFRNIYPYDNTRVTLKGDAAVEGSDYINASFIDGHSDTKHTYIASQGPTDLTVSRFLEMLWQYQIPTIVMLTRCVEDGREKCEQYWSDQMDTPMTKENYCITLKSFVPYAEYQIRKFQLKAV